MAQVVPAGQRVIQEGRGGRVIMVSDREAQALRPPWILIPKDQESNVLNTQGRPAQERRPVSGESSSFFGNRGQTAAAFPSFGSAVATAEPRRVESIPQRQPVGGGGSGALRPASVGLPLGEVAGFPRRNAQEVVAPTAAIKEALEAGDISTEEAVMLVGRAGNPNPTLIVSQWVSDQVVAAQGSTGTGQPSLTGATGQTALTGNTVEDLATRDSAGSGGTIPVINRATVTPIGTGGGGSLALSQEARDRQLQGLRLENQTADAIFRRVIQERFGLNLTGFTQDALRLPFNRFNATSDILNFGLPTGLAQGFNTFLDSPRLTQEGLTSSLNAIRGGVGDPGSVSAINFEDTFTDQEAKTPFVNFQPAFNAAIQPFIQGVNPRRLASLQRSLGNQFRNTVALNPGRFETAGDVFEDFEQRGFFKTPQRFGGP